MRPLQPSGSAQEYGFDSKSQWAYGVRMPSAAPSEIDLKIADVLASLPEERKNTVLEFALFVRQQTAESSGDTAWEKMIADPIPRPRLEAYLRELPSMPSAPLAFPSA